MLLILTNSTDATSDYLVRRLAAASIKVVRVNTESLFDDFPSTRQRWKSRTENEKLVNFSR